MNNMRGAIDAADGVTISVSEIAGFTGAAQACAGDEGARTE